MLDAGDSALADLGLQGFTLRECARRAGVSHAAPKHHFGDVRGFLTAIACRGYDRLTARLKTEIGKAASLEDEFKATGIAYVGFADEHPEHFRIMFRGDLLDRRSEALIQATDRTLTELTNVIRRQRGESEIVSARAGDESDYQSLVDDIVIGWSHIHGFAHLVLEGHLSMAGERRAELLSTASARLSQLIRTDAGNT